MEWSSAGSGAIGASQSQKPELGRREGLALAPVFVHLLHGLVGGALVHYFVVFGAVNDQIAGQAAFGS